MISVIYEYIYTDFIFKKFIFLRFIFKNASLFLSLSFSLLSSDHSNDINYTESVVLFKISIVKSSNISNIQNSKI